MLLLALRAPPTELEASLNSQIVLVVKSVHSTELQVNLMTATGEAEEHKVVVVIPVLPLEMKELFVPLGIPEIS